MPVDKRIELEIALRDTASQALKAIADNLEKINKGLAASGGGDSKASEGADAFKKIKEATEGINKHAEEGGKTVTTIAEGMLPLAATLLRSTLARGVVYAEVGRFVAGMITDSSRERQQLHLMAQDTGLHEGFISMLTQAQQKAGIESPQARSNIVNVMNVLQGMTYGRGSPLTQRLDSIGQGVVATELENLMMAGKKEEAMRRAIEYGGGLPDVERRKFADAFGVQPSFFKDMTHLLTTVQPAVEMSIQVADNWMLGWQVLIRWGDETLNWWKNLGVKLGNAILSPTQYPKDDIRTKYSDPGPLSSYLQEKMQGWKERNKETLKVLEDILTIFQNKQNKESIEKRAAGGSVLAGRRYLVGEKGPEMFRSNAGWMEMLEGPDIIEPKTGGYIEPNSSLDEYFSNKKPWTQQDRWGSWQSPSTGGFMPRDPSAEADWDKWRHDEHGILHARPTLPPGLSAEQNWEHYNRWLTGPWGWLPGTEEGQPAWPGWREGDKPSIGGLKNWEEYFESKKPSWDELSIGRSPDWPYDPQGEPIGYRRLMDEELGGGGAASLGAEITFKNVPDGVETEADGEGFDNFTVNKTRQLQGA